MRHAAAALGPFVSGVRRVLAQTHGEKAVLREVRPLMQSLVAVDDWLPEAHARSQAESYQQHLLYLDPAGAFSIVSFVWGPGQKTPVHDHTVWGVVGVLRGEELSHDYRATPAGGLERVSTSRLARGEVVAVGPQTGDIHLVENPLADRSSISIHIYGADIGRTTRHVFDPVTGARRDFISGYSATPPLSFSIQD